MGETAGQHLREILDYIQAVEKANATVVYKLPFEDVLLRGLDLESLPGVSLAQSPDSDRWLSIERLNKTPPPPLPPSLAGLAALGEDPFSAPHLSPQGIELLREQDKACEGGERPSEAAKDALDAYAQGPWTRWSEAERPRRKSISLYQKLFQLCLGANGGSGPIDLVWGMCDASWAVQGKIFDHPLFSQSCAVALDPDTFELSVSPTERAPSFEKDAFEEMAVPGLAPFKDAWKEFLRTCEDSGARLVPFAPETQEPIASKALALLSASGRLERDAPRAPAASSALACTFGWALFTRKRTNHFLLQDVENLSAALAELDKVHQELPQAARAFVSEGADEDDREAISSFRGLSSAGASDARELYFPLPYNAEQVRIIQELERSAGVVVQGPPGTGKTHTIANVICHYLAQGKKVLVTSKDEPALRVVKQKIPDKLRQLCVALLGDEADGAKQFEESIKMILEEVAKIDPAAEQAAVERAESRIGAIHGALASIDADVFDLARAHRQTYPVDGQELSLEAVARLVGQERASFSWMEHAQLPQDEPSPARAEILTRQLAAFGRAKASAEGLENLLAQPIEDMEPLAKGAQLAELSAHARRRLALLGTPGLLPLPPMDRERAAPMVQSALEAVERQLKAMEEFPQAWSRSMDGPAAELRQDAAFASQFEALAKNVERLDSQRRVRLGEAARIPPGAEALDDYREAVAALAGGKNPFGLSAMFGEAKRVKAMAEATQFAGAAPDREGWAKILGVVDFLRSSRAAVAHFEAWARSAGAEGLDEQAGLSTRLGACAALARPLRRRLLADQELGELLDLLRKEFQWKLGALDAKALGALQTHLRIHQDILALGEASARLNDVARQAFLGEPYAQNLRALASRAVEGAFEDADAQAWDGEKARVAHLRQIQADLSQANLAVMMARQLVGEPWARKLAQSSGAALEAMCSPSWRQAWRWRAWSNFLETTAGHGEFGALFQKRAALEAELAGAYREAALKRTWIEVHKGCSPKVQQALQAYMASIQALGRGTGVRAERHRKAARESLSVARQAVRCWIMPHWRVSETMPAEIGAFDLVIVDEASQSDIWALPAILRGHKILIVGDHKQVSPAAVGVTEAQIQSLHQLHLSRQPHGRQMAQDKSIYDLGRVVFAANSVMLKEHFRCAPSIIEFSNRTFYGGEIVPLRSPKRGEGVGATLVDIHVKNGFRDAKDANLPEALAIVDEIQAMIQDPVFAGKTFGVVTLMGSAQENLLRQLIGDRVAQEEIVERQIMVGNPARFQGSERDVILLSMVIAREPGAKGKVRGMQKSLVNEQRLNVAMSRARDRVCLVRSVQISDLGDPDSLSAKLIAHFQQPFAQEAHDVARLRELCESGFEEDVFDALTGRGYRVSPQVQCGKFRIDMVVEGDEGERVAIECDGDRYHDGSVWLDDLRRQRVLERAGWVFWRCFASSFARDREGVLADLFGFLERQGVFPARSDGAGSSPLVEARVVEPDLERSGEDSTD